MLVYDSGKKDFTAEVTVLFAQVDKSAAENLDDAITSLLAMEKKCRVSNDPTNLVKVCKFMLKVCKEQNDWPKLNAVLALINKRCAQIKSVITAVVAEALGFVDQTPSLEVKMELIKSLKDICAGKIDVESESAKLHFMLSKMYEDRGDLDAACDAIQDVHVETYGSLSKREKAEYILEQIRVALLKKDYIRAMIHSRKMNLKTTEEAGFEDVKIRFYRMMIEYYMVEKNTWEIAQAYYKIASTPYVPIESSNDANGAVEMKGETSDISSNAAAVYKAQCTEALESCILFLLMSKYDNHQSDMLYRVKKQLTAELKEVATSMQSVFPAAINLFTTKEIIPSPLPDQDVLDSHQSLIYPSDPQQPITTTVAATATALRALLQDRIVQHNLRVVAAYYRRITTQRLCELLDLSQDQLEGHLAQLCEGGDLFLKIDRPAGIVDFVQKKMPEQVLTEWSADIGQLLHLMEATCHLINRENMVYKA
mmetsp:Transcript_29680/g.42377  ORF Transcript_29680/g.42377 Transcript_29680/m.42377 type:complete len:481 (+) Transcript_29680:54-1496(+)